MDALLELNKQGLFSRLAKVRHTDEFYVANELIDVLSERKERDKRLVNDYSKDEIQTCKIRRPSGLKTVRMLTKKGIERYLHEGKLFDYKNACSYFSVTPVDKTTLAFTEELRSFMTSEDDAGTYNTKKILKWLFDKRKSCVVLGNDTTIENVVKIFGSRQDANQDKLRFLKEFLKGPSRE